VCSPKSRCRTNNNTLIFDTILSEVNHEKFALHVSARWRFDLDIGVVNADSSIIFGCIFLGDAFYFLYGLFKPRWYKSAEISVSATVAPNLLNGVPFDVTTNVSSPHPETALAYGVWEFHCCNHQGCRLTFMPNGNPMLFVHGSACELPHAPPSQQPSRSNQPYDRQQGQNSSGR
jgi:hypothetical protein